MLLPTPARSHALVFRMDRFEEAQRLVLTLRTARGEPIPPCPRSTAPLASKLQWLEYLFSPEGTEEIAEQIAEHTTEQIAEQATEQIAEHTTEHTTERIAGKAAELEGNKKQLNAWLAEAFGGSCKWLNALSGRLWEASDCEVVTERGVVSVAQFLREEETVCHGVSSSSLAIMSQLQGLLSKEAFNRLVQVAAIRYPSPLPVIRAVVMEQNKDWGALFDQDPVGFITCLKRATTMIRRSFSSRSFHLWTLCGTNS